MYVPRNFIRQSGIIQEQIKVGIILLLYVTMFSVTHDLASYTDRIVNSTVPVSGYVEFTVLSPAHCG